MFSMSPDEFRRLVAEELDSLPDDVLGLLENVAVIVEDDAPADEPGLLGYYDGVPLTERTDSWGAFGLPDRVVVCRNPTLEICDSFEQVVAEVRITLVHEIAHFHGIDERRIHELGWG